MKSADRIEQENKSLSQLRERIRDCTLVDSSDEYLLKWLIARNFNVDLAEKMLRNSLEWRRINRVDEILTSYEIPEIIEKYYSIGQCGFDKLGCPLFVSQQGLIDIRGILQSTTKKEMVRFMIYLMEKNAQVMRSNRLTCKSQNVTVIADMEFLSMKQMTYGPVTPMRDEMLKILEAHYPETLRKVFVINAPRVFTIIYAMVKPFLNQVTIDKIRIFGSDKKQWTAAILEDIDPNQLPAYYGGEMTDPDGDPKCPSKFNMGGEVPKELYMCNAPPKPKDSMESFTLNSGKKKEFEFSVSSHQSILRWEFMSEGGDIGFCISFKNSETVMDLLPRDRVDSHLIMEEGQIICDQIGKYVVEFDNSFSYLKSKKVYYSISMEPPQ